MLRRRDGTSDRHRRARRATRCWLSALCASAPEGATALNPAFDVTPARYVTAIITRARQCCGRRSTRATSRAPLTGGGAMTEARPSRSSAAPGFYEMDGCRTSSASRVETPFGCAVRRDRARHTRRRAHGVPAAARRRAPHPPRRRSRQRANIWALASLGVEHIISVSAVGSLQREHRAARHGRAGPTHRPHDAARPSTFFGSGIVAHIAFDAPFCPSLSAALAAARRARRARRTQAARSSSSKARRFRRAPSRSSTAAGARTSSA